jgi:hypothetical protein
MSKWLASMVIGAGLMYFAADFFSHGHPELVDAQTRWVALLAQSPATSGQH